MSLFKYILCSYLSPNTFAFSTSKYTFKYILCSYLSKIPILHLKPLFYLNTSYVLIYPLGSLGGGFAI